MTPNELHELLQTLKGKNSFDVNIAETKKTNKIFEIENETTTTTE